MRAMSARNFVALVPLAFLFSGCSGLHEGTVVAKKSRRGLPNAYATWDSFRYYEPDVYWVHVEGRDDQGRRACKNVILFRHDWAQLRVGDRRDCQRGFAPGPGDK